MNGKNETILIDEEIKQYRTYFDHANLVEDLRKTHLGNEAIHSCAYIEHLNGKVDNLVKNLQEKNINGLLIKLSMDKIKILSEYFDDVNVKYKFICQFVSEKIERLVYSFEKSVLSNEFYNSISMMTKFYDANTILNVLYRLYNAAIQFQEHFPLTQLILIHFESFLKLVFSIYLKLHYKFDLYY
ncbi:unnamed protein product [Rotaria magnacalcarata]